MKKLIFLFLFIALGFSQQTGKWYGDSIAFMQDWSQFDNSVWFADTIWSYYGADSFPAIYVDGGKLHFGDIGLTEIDSAQLGSGATLKKWVQVGSFMAFIENDNDTMYAIPDTTEISLFISDTIGIIETDDTTYMTADNDTFRVSTEKIVKWEVDDAASYWIAQEFKQISFGFDGRANGDYGSVWGGRTCYATNYSAVVGGYLDSAKANFGFVAGGQANEIEYGEYSGIISGHTNTAHGGYSFIGAGSNNVIGFGATVGAIAGGNQDSIGNNSAGCFIGGGIQNRIIGGGDYNTITGGGYNVVEGVGSHNNIICGGLNDTIKNCTESFIGGGEKNYMLSASETAIVGGNDNYIVGATQAFIGGGNYNFIQALRGAIVGGYQDSVKGTYSGIVSGYRNTTWGSYTAICGGSYNDIGSGQNYSFIGAGNANFVGGSYSAIIGGYQDTVHAKMSIALGGIRNIIRADGGDSCNVVAGVEAVVDSCLGTFAMNCHIKKADSTFGFSKQIWVIEAGETTKVEAKKVVTSEYEGDSSTIKGWLDVDSLDAIHSVVRTSMVLVNDATFKRGYFTVEQAFDYTGNAVIITVDDNWIVVDVWCEITTTFDGTTPDVTIGDAADANGILDVDPTKTGWTGNDADDRGDYLWDGVSNHTIQKIYSTSTVLNVYVTSGGGMTQGEGIVHLGIIRL